MKTIFTTLMILIISFFIYGQNETRISQNSSNKYVEPYVAINPVNGDILVIYFYLDETNRDLEYVVIKNGSVYATGIIDNAVDPSVAFDGSGAAYICYLDRSTTNPSIYVVKSPPGTYSFTSPVVAIQGVQSNNADKPFIYIDTNPSSPFYNRIYVATTKFPGDYSEIHFSYSTNNGSTFQELSNPISSSTPLGQDQLGAFPIVDNNSNVFVFWYREIPIPNTSQSSRYVKFFYNKSTDGGVNFIGEQQILGEFERPGIKDNEGYFNIKVVPGHSPFGIRISPFPFVSIDKNNGTIYLIANVREDTYPEDFINSNHLTLLKSTNNGTTWSLKNIPFTLDVFMPYINCGNDGRIFITCYDSNLPPFDNKTTSMRLIISEDGGNTWNQLSYTDIFASITFDPAYNQGGFIGDYICSLIKNDVLYAVYNRPVGNIMQMYLAELPVKIETILQNLKVVNNNLLNLDNSHIKVDGVSYPSPSSPLFNLLREADIEPANLFYTPYKFYKWNDLGTRNPLLENVEINYENNVFKTLFAETKPLTVRNTLEGTLDGGTILFGEKNFDVISRISPHTENAFIYNPPSIQSTYLAEAEQTHNLYNTNWNFVSWEDGTTNTTREDEIYQSSPSEWRAYYKSHFASNSSLALSTGSQRKLFCFSDGTYGLVYVSDNKLWLTGSQTTNFNSTWDYEAQLSNSNHIVKNPSVDLYNDEFVIVYENYNPSISEYAVYLYDYYQGQAVKVADINPSYFGYAKPVVAFLSNDYNNGEIIVVYKKSSSEGLKYKRRYKSAGNWVWSGELDISNTNSTSINPSIAGYNVSGSKYFHIVWQQSNYYIKYQWAYPLGGSWRFQNLYTVSSGGGFEINASPSVSIAGSNHYPVVSWTGMGNDLRKILGKEDLTSNKRVVVRAKNSLGWGNFFIAGEEVEYSTNNSTNSSSQQTVITWSQSNGNAAKWVKRINGSFNNVHSLSHPGLYTSLSSGVDLTKVKAVVSSTAANPLYKINRSTTDFHIEDDEGGGIQKITSVPELTYGRSGVIVKNEVEFIFNIGDIVLEDSTIRFTEVPDSVLFTLPSEINTVLITETFALSNNSELFFTNYYFTNNTEIADTALTEQDYVSYRVELVKASSGEVIGIFNEITYSKQNLEKYENVDYQVNCSGINSDEYYFRLVVDVGGDASYYLADIQNDGTNLLKKNYMQINFYGNPLPTEYILSQNYPNPFNPTTTIRYQLPKDGMVTLKVYDILGAEVATLVNEEKIAGRYEVNFDASGHSGNVRNLASGVYIYRLNVNDFVNVKKMVMLK